MYKNLCTKKNNVTINVSNSKETFLVSAKNKGQKLTHTDETNYYLNKLT